MKSGTRHVLVGWTCVLSALLFAFFLMLAVVASGEDTPFWAPFMVLLPGACLFAAAIRCFVQERNRRDAASAANRTCRGCRYPLRDLPVHRCPECGLAFDPNDTTTFEYESPVDVRDTDTGLVLIVCVVIVGFICLAIMLPMLAR